MSNLSENKTGQSLTSLLDKGILTVFQLFLSELLKELLRQPDHETPVHFLLEIKNISFNKEPN